MRAVVTGVAGFIGSRLAAACIAKGWDVVGIDCIRPYYDVALKRSNLDALARMEALVFAEVDLHADPLDGWLRGADVVFHLAAQPGVRASWVGFDDYSRDNIVATQRLLAAASVAGVGRIVYSSSSSVYGDADKYPVAESALPRPVSPYGVSKLAAEHLCGAFGTAGHFDVVSLRYFTVYGPGQRPDMAIHRLVKAALTGARFPLFGDGSQIRDFTFVSDVVSANIAAATCAVSGPLVANIAGGSAASLHDVIEAIERLTGRTVALNHGPWQAGDVHRTGADTSRAAKLLGWHPRTDLVTGLTAQIDWQGELLDAGLAGIGASA